MSREGILVCGGISVNGVLSLDVLENAEPKLMNSMDKLRFVSLVTSSWDLIEESETVVFKSLEMQDQFWERVISYNNDSNETVNDGDKLNDKLNDKKISKKIPLIDEQWYKYILSPTSCIVTYNWGGLIWTGTHDIARNKIYPLVLDAIDRDECTYSVTEDNYICQQWYRCSDCFPDLPNEGVCQSCAMTCHRGHNLTAADVKVNNEVNNDVDNGEILMFCDCKSCLKDIKNKNMEASIKLSRFR